MDKRRRTNKRGIGNALGVLDMNAGNLSETSRALSIPISTVASWRDNYATDPLVEKYRNIKNEELAERFRVVAVMAIERLQHEINNVKVDNLMVLAATGADKQLLLTGQPTAISQDVAAGRALVKLLKNKENKDISLEEANVIMAESFKRGGLELEN